MRKLLIISIRCLCKCLCTYENSRYLIEIVRRRLFSQILKFSIWHARSGLVHLSSLPAFWLAHARCCPRTHGKPVLNFSLSPSFSLSFFLSLSLFLSFFLSFFLSLSISLSLLPLSYSYSFSLTLALHIFLSTSHTLTSTPLTHDRKLYFILLSNFGFPVSSLSLSLLLLLALFLSTSYLSSCVH